MVSGHHLPVSETPFEWRFVDRPMMARFIHAFCDYHTDFTYLGFVLAYLNMALHSK